MRRSGPRAAASIAGGGVLDALRSAALLRRRPLEAEEASALIDLTRSGDVLGRAAAAYALSRHPGAEVDAALLGLLHAEDACLRATAALVFSGREFHRAAEAGLVAELARGGFGGMLAELALEEWVRAAPQRVRPLLRRELLRRGADGVTAARLARLSSLDHLPPGEPPAQGGEGLRVAQVFLQGRVDGRLLGAGAGDGGGLATLVVHLARALGRQAEVEHAVTIARAVVDDGDGAAAVGREEIGPGASIERIAFGPDGYLATSKMWQHRLAAERALEEALRRLAPLDVVHLRFADVGTFAAARVCRRLGVPVCFTLAADPHVVIRSRERRGELDRATFAEADGREHLLFRAHVVEWMLETAEGLVAFPRADAERDLRELLAVEAEGRPIHPVSEGISLRTIDRAAEAVAHGKAPGAVRDLAAAVRALPPARARLPLLLSVGRFHRVKGFARLVEAWAGDPVLRDSFNLVVVGGELARPTEEERSVLEAVREVGQRLPQAAEGLVLLGHRSHDDVAQILHATREGIPYLVGPRGVYACASEKEEFGLALLEALAAGLPVVAPRGGGPDTYVEEGYTGCLVDTTSLEELRAGIGRAARLRHDEERAAAATALVRSRFSIDAMAEGLTGLYLGLRAAPPVDAAA